MTLLGFRLSHYVVLWFAIISVVTINAFGAIVSGAKYMGESPSLGEYHRVVFDAPNVGLTKVNPPRLKHTGTTIHTVDNFIQIPKNRPKSLTVSEELSCLALNIYFEARGEPENGQHAVGHVVMNRVENNLFPKSVCEVVRQGGQELLHRCQFSWWCDGQSDEPEQGIAWENSLRIAQTILVGASDDPTGGALWYHADYVSPYWQTAFTKGPQIGQHIFYTS